MHILTRVRLVLWIACACVLLSAPLARAADRSLAADFDGDGKSDRVAIDHSEPSVLHVWLSRTGTTDRLHNPRALLWIAATDVDGDNRPELIATEASAEGLRIWKRDGARPGFRPYAPRRSPAHATPPTNGRTVGESPDDAEDALAGSLYVPPVLNARGALRACHPNYLTHTAADDPVASFAWSRPSAPRAPPASPA